MWINLEPTEVELVKNCLSIAHTATPSFVQGSMELLSKIDEALKVDDADAVFIQQARDDYETPSDNSIEIDDEPAVSAGEDGRWVAAWVWVSNDDVEACEECGAIPGTSDYGTVGDGFDGLCPSCADKAEEDDEIDDSDTNEYRGQDEDEDDE